MKHLCKNIILVVVSYSLVFAAPVSAKTVSASQFTAVKNYVNGSASKSFLDLTQKLEKDLPPKFYEVMMQRTKGANGKQWFQAAKIADNYSYFRFGDSKVFIRTAKEKGQTVLYANGLKIDQQDFKNLKAVENKMLYALVLGMSAKKTSFLDLFEFKKSFAGQIISETAKGSTAIVAPPVKTPCETYLANLTAIQIEAVDEAAKIRATEDYKKLNPQLAQECTPPAAVAANSQVVRSKRDMWILAAASIGMLLFMIFMASRNKDNKKNNNGGKNNDDEEPEDGVGRGDSPTKPNKGHVNCGGKNAQCGDNAGEPTAPPDDAEDYNYYDLNEDSDGSGRGTNDQNPVSKTRKK